MKRIALYFLSSIVVLLVGLLGFEGIQRYMLGSWKLLIGVNLPCSVYTPTLRQDHLGCMKTFAHPDGNIRYLDLGDATDPVIVLLHGTPTNSRLYRKMIQPLVDTGYRVIAPDMLGFGASDMIDLSKQSTKQQAERIISLLDHLEIETFALGGHDQGSLRMWSIATTHPEKIKHLFVFNSISVWEGFHPPAGFGTVNFTTRFTAWAMKSMLLGRVFAYGALLGGVQDKSVVTHHMINGYLMPLLQQKNNSYWQFISDFVAIKQEVTAFGSAMKDLQFPITIIWGGGDTILDADDQIPVLQKHLMIPEENIFILDHAKHFIQEEQPARIVQIMISQLGKF